MNRLPRPDVIVVLAFLIAALAFLWEVTLGGKILLPVDNLYSFPPFNSLVTGQLIPHNLLIGDMVLQNISWKSLARDAILGGELPLWNPYIFAGVPFLAAGQPGVLYPLGVIFYPLRPEYAYGWFTAFHLFLAGVFTYFYLRIIKVERFGALIAGFAFMFSGFLVVSFLWPMVVSTAIWAPFVLATIELVISGEEQGKGFQLAWAMVGALGVGLQFLAGHMEISFYILFTMLYYAVCRLAIMLWSTRNLWLTLRAGIALLLMVGLGAGIATAQLIPFQEVIKENVRAGSATYRDVIGWALPKMQVFSFIMPDFFGNPTHHSYFDVFDLKTKLVGNNLLGKPTDPPGTIFWGVKNYVEAASYVGVLTLVLTGVAVLFRRNRYTWIFLSYAVFSLLLAFGAPLYAIFFYGIPGFDQLHTPFRWIYPYTISVTMLAGIGAGHLAASTASSPGWRGKLRSAYSLSVLGLGILTVAALAVALVFRERTIALSSSLLARAARTQQAFGSPQMFFSYEFRNVFILGLLLVGSGLVLWLASRSTTSRRVWQSLAVIILLGDVFFFGAGFNSKADVRDLYQTPPSIEFLKNDKDVFRIASFGTDDILKPDLGMRYGLQDVRGYDTIILRRYVDFWRLMEEPHGLMYSMIKTLVKPEALTSKWISLLNVKYVLTSQPLNLPGLDLVYDKEIRIYRNEAYQPRAFLVEKVEAASNPGEAMAKLRQPDFDPRREVVVQGWPADNAGLRLAPTGQLAVPRITTYGTNSLKIEVSSDRDAVLVLSDTYFPDWVAQVDGKDVTVYRADYNFRAVPVPEGNHTITFKYSPLSFKVGLLGSGISILVVLLGLAGAYAARFYRQGGTEIVQRVARNSVTPMATSLLNKAVDVAFAMLMLRVLHAENAGKYMFATIVYTYFEIITNFGLTTLVQRDVAKDRAQSNKYLMNTLFLRLFLVLLAAPAVAAFMYFWRATFGLDRDTALAIALLGVSLLPANIAAAFSAMFLAHEKMEYPAIVSVGTTLLKVALGAGALMLGWGIVGLAGVSVVVNSITAVVFIILVAGVLLRPKLEADVRLARGMLRTSWPLMLNQMLATVFFRIDTPIMYSTRGSSEVGYYGTAYKFIDGLNIIPSSFTIALFPVLSRYADSARDTFVRAYVMALRFLLIVSIPIAVGTTFLAEPVILLFGGREYVPHSVVALQVLIWFLPFSYVNSLTQYVLIAINRQRFITLSFFIVTGFNMTANLILIPRYGYVGAGAVTILSEIVLLMPFYYAVRRHLGGVPLLSLIPRPTIAAAIMAVALWYLRAWNPFLVVICGIAVYIIVLAAVGTFNAEDAAILRRLLGRQRAYQPEEAL